MIFFAMIFSFQAKPKNLNSHSRGLHLLAGFEAFKGLLVMCAGFGFLRYLNSSTQVLNEVGNSIIEHLHLNPAHHIPQIFLLALANVTDKNILWIAIGALLYSILRFLEAFGLWKNRGWGQWIAIISAGLYVPIELIELNKGFSYVKATITFLNMLVVFYLLYIRFWKVSGREQDM